MRGPRGLSVGPPPATLLHLPSSARRRGERSERGGSIEGCDGVPACRRRRDDEPRPDSRHSSGSTRDDRAAGAGVDVRVVTGSDGADDSGESARLATLARTRLLDSPAEEPYDRIARLAARVLDAPIATVTLIDEDRQFYKACVGLPEPLRSVRQTPLEYSFCKHTVALGSPLVIGDTRSDDRVSAMLSVTAFGVQAYAGVPLLVDGFAIGTLCVMDMRPRTWTGEQVGMLIDLAAAVMTEIQLRLTVEQVELASEAAHAARAEAERANRAKSEFLAMMSHDLRTPLNAIGGYRQLLELGVHGPLTDGQRETLERIKRAQDHLLHLISEVLSFSQLEAQAMPLAWAHVPVDATLRGLEALVRPQLDAKGLTFVYRGDDPDVLMYVDAERLTRVVVNLLTNAIKFTPSGGRVSLEWRAEATRIVIRVEDTGIGIPPDRLDAIFEPFIQIPGQKAMNPDGVGLGLAIGQRLARAMHGNLIASSVPGMGTTFELMVLRNRPEANGSPG